MFVCKVAVCFVLVVCSAKKVYGAEQNLNGGTFCGFPLELLLSKLEILQDKLIETDQKLTGLSQEINQKLTVLQTETKSAMEKQQEYIDQKLSGLSETMDHKLTQSSVVMKEHHDSMNRKLFEQENLSKVMLIAIDQLGQNITKQQALSSSIIKTDRESINEKLVVVTASIKQLDQNLAPLISQSNALLKEYKEFNDQKLNDLVQTIDGQVKTLLTHSNKTASAATEKQNQMQKAIEELASKNDIELFMLNSMPNMQNVTFISCKQYPPHLSGKYMIQPTRQAAPFLGYCDQNVYGGGWLVVQYRYDGSVDFYRNWESYRNGFGSLEGEFWLGLEYLHRLTSARKHELLVELKDFKGKYAYARYDEFAIGSETEKYALKTIGYYTGTAGDSLFWHRNSKFTTMDQNNINNSAYNRADLHKGGWWYTSGGSFSNLNGKYGDFNFVESMNWYEWNFFQSMAYTRMMIREI